MQFIRISIPDGARMRFSEGAAVPDRETLLHKNFCRETSQVRG